MDQIKIGKFIAQCRKNKNLTQMQLAEKLGITDRAISKWETGKSMPDCSIMLDLCNTLKISVNDLLNGEVVTMNNYDKKAEQALFDMVKQKEEADKRLLTIEIVIGIACVLSLIISAIICTIFHMEETIEAVIILTSLIPLLVVTPFMIKIEQKAGYYKCAKCGHKYVPKYSSVFMAMHMGRTRYMKCPACHKYSWNKKEISKD